MESDEFESPAVAALREFRERVAQDTVLPAPVKAALAEDLASASPHAFGQLKAAIAAHVQSHENRNPES
jgi:Na+-transporting methylmalonyl-CoA/oxaloacetate decarboxylase gamma subunit